MARDGSCWGCIHMRGVNHVNTACAEALHDSIASDGRGRTRFRNSDVRRSHFGCVATLVVGVDRFVCKFDNFPSAQGNVIGDAISVKVTFSFTFASLDA